MKITILSVGRLKEAYLRDAAAEYGKRLGKYCSLKMIEVEDERTPASCSAKEQEIILEKEADRLLKHISADMYVVALAIDGRQLTSVQFAEKIEELGVRGESHLCFVIGGSLGLADKILEQSRFRLSFSKMTFPHQLAKIILMEQVYRCFRINYNEPYHK